MVVVNLVLRLADRLWRELGCTNCIELLNPAQRPSNHRCWACGCLEWVVVAFEAQILYEEVNKPYLTIKVNPLLQKYSLLSMSCYQYVIWDMAAIFCAIDVPPE